MASGGGVDKLLKHVWKLHTNENWDEYMKAVGVGLVLRKVGNNITSYEEWKRDGDEWTLNITSTFKNKTVKFKLSEEFDEETMDGRKVKSVITVEGDKLIHCQSAAKLGDVNSVITREVLDDGRLLVTFVAEGKNVTAKRYFVPNLTAAS